VVERFVYAISYKRLMPSASRQGEKSKDAGILTSRQWEFKTAIK
jgi:hypothetical protein